MTDEYIRKQEAIDIVVFECGKWTGLAKEISKQLKQLPPADVASIRHSRWIKTEDGAECEKCGREAVYQIVDDHWEYEPWCPHCGSKMDGHGES